MPGIEPGIFGFVDQRLIHWATRSRWLKVENLRIYKNLYSISCRLRDGKPWHDQQQKPIPLASDGEVDSELSQLLLEADEVSLEGMGSGRQACNV